MPRITVITPAYNAGRYIAASMDSILRQTWRDFSYIVIDDGSSDDTYEIATRSAMGDRRVTVLRNPRNCGIAFNRNRGVELADSDFIAWQDADDVARPTRLEHQVEFLQANADVGIVGGFMQFFGRGRDTLRKYPADDAEIRRMIFRYSPVAQPAAAVRRKAIEEAGPYNECFEPAEDLDMAFRIGLRYKFANLQEIVLSYRDNPSSATYGALRKIEWDTLQIRAHYARHGYHATCSDLLFNLTQLGTMLLLPPGLRIRLFNRWRNSGMDD